MPHTPRPRPDRAGTGRRKRHRRDRGHPHSAWPLRLGHTALDSQLEKAFEVVKTL